VRFFPAPGWRKRVTLLPACSCLSAMPCHPRLIGFQPSRTSARLAMAADQLPHYLTALWSHRRSDGKTVSRKIQFHDHVDVFVNVAVQLTRICCSATEIGDGQPEYIFGISYTSGAVLDHSMRLLTRPRLTT
jgi:hypothetical protein